MTDSTEQTDRTELTLDAEIRHTEMVEPASRLFWRLVGELVAFAPSYRDSRDGRKKAKGMQVILVVIGIVLMATGGTALEGGGFWIVLGIVIACLAFVIPVEELKKRSWKSTIKKKQKPRPRRKWKPGRVELDDKAVSTWEGDDRVRRVRVDRGKHDLEVRTHGDHPCLGVLPLGHKKHESIWVCATGAVDGVEATDTIEDDEMDRPARLTPGDWEQLWDKLRQIEES